MTDYDEFDLSPGMVALARKRLGDETDLRVADFGEHLPYDDDSFDVVVCSLALHYLKDWIAPLTELRRVLRPGDRLVTPCPTRSYTCSNHQDREYFTLTNAGDRTAFVFLFFALHAP